MDRTDLMNPDLLARFVDVLYMTNQGHIPPEIKRLLKLRKLSSLVMSLDKYVLIRDKLRLIGTAIIDTEGLNTQQQQKIAQIIESLEMEHIGVILLTSRVNMPIKSFSLAPTKTSFSMTETMESVSIDDLWIQISVNLAYRKKSTGISVRPALSDDPARSVSKNKLAEQLSLAGALVESLTGELRLAGRVQQDFLPSQLPNTEQIQWSTIFLPAEWVSGDIYNVVRIDEQHIGFYIADVVGHGMPAALLTIFIKQALVMRETIENNYRIFSPAEVMQNLNIRLALQKLSGYQFATCCYCLLNTKTLQLTYARAGHPYPILLRGKQPPKQLEIRGSLLGIFEQAEYTQQTIQLMPGDKLLLYSDGAEPFIGKFDDKAGFGFIKDFIAIKDKPIVELMDGFHTLIQNIKISPSEVDDITLVGFEVLNSL